MHGQHALAIGPSAGPNRRDDLLVRPTADAGRAVRRDIGRVHGPEGTLELLAARVRLPLALGVTAPAGSGAEDVLAPRDVFWASRLSDAGREDEETNHHEKSVHGTHANAK